MQHIVPVVDTALRQASVSLESLDAIAFTSSPGLIGALLVGAEFAKSLSLALAKPLISVHHMQAHVMANMISENPPSFPFLCLTVSGGHTQIVLVRSPLDMEVIGQTLDDAAGEAFDKTAKLLGLPYPGGPLIDKYAKTGKVVYSFPEPRIPGYDFSFSGLKTSILYFLGNAGKSNAFHAEITASPEEKAAFISDNLENICASVQHRIVSILLNKLAKAAKDHHITTVCIAGGVSANSGLRSAIQEMGATLNWDVHIPAFQYCTDNAAMIAMTAHYKYEAGQFADLDVMPVARASW
jgi:N6-L-threonylcarbamoyladenine synthase